MCIDCDLFAGTLQAISASVQGGSNAILSTKKNGSLLLHGTLSSPNINRVEIPPISNGKNIYFMRNSQPKCRNLHRGRKYLAVTKVIPTGLVEKLIGVQVLLHQQTLTTPEN